MDESSAQTMFGGTMNFSLRCFSCFLSLPAMLFPALAAATVTTVTSFNGTVGSYPTAEPLLVTLDGNVFGTTGFGGSTGNGSVYRMAPSGVISVVGALDRCCYASSLIRAQDGSLYGVSAGNSYEGVLGAAFRMSPDGSITTLATFAPSFGSGAPTLMRANDGNFYGTVPVGGGGTIFQLTPDGTYTVIATISGDTWPVDGSPNSRLVQGRDGNLYGTTDWVIYRVTLPAGPDKRSVLTHVARFDGRADALGIKPLRGIQALDAQQPTGGLILGADGNFYGLLGSAGDVRIGHYFRISPAGQFTKLADFGGTNPRAPQTMTLGLDGHFYAVSNNWGNRSADILRLTARGEMEFIDSTGYSGGLAQLPDGRFLGTTTFGGAFDLGSIYQLTLPKPMTALSAKAEILDLSPTTVHLRMKAVLRSVSPSAPLAGRRLTFSAPNGSVLCSAVTDATGTAACGTPGTYLRTSINSEYFVDFAGDAIYGSSEAVAPLIH